jgi:diguanylate cyclase (GGDEF)-like protein/PAS domain S-box-containing protein
MAMILVVDDNDLNREVLSILLGDAGYQVQEAADGAEALDVVRRARPDLVISDVLMPVMSGVEFARQLHADPLIADIPVIFYTAAYRLNEGRDLAQSCGVHTVLSKPSKPQAIYDAVAEVLGMSPAIFANGPSIATPAAAPAPADEAERPSPFLGNLSGLQQRLWQAFEQEWSQADKGGSRRLPATLVHSLDAVPVLGLRLTALVELELALSSQRDPQQLLEVFCRGMQSIMQAQYAAVCFAEVDQTMQRLVMAGVPEEVHAAFQRQPIPAGHLATAFASGAPQRAESAVNGAAQWGLPASHPPVRTLLAAPVKSATRTYGWLYVADKSDGAPFDGVDEQIISTLAAQLALTYENLSLYDDMQQYAAWLEREISDHRRAEETLLESELRFRQMAANILEVWFLVDPAESQMLYISPAYEKVWGRSCESLYANPMSWIDAVHPDDQARAWAASDEREAHGRFDVQYRILRPDGEVRWVWARGFPILDETGQLYRVAGVAEDITERVEQQNKIARLTRIYATLSSINALIMRVRDRKELFQDACRIAVDEGAFQMAWIGQVDPDTQESKVVAWFGGQAGYVDKIRFTARPGAPFSDRPACRAVIEKKPVVCNNVRSDPSLAALQDELHQRGHQAVAAFPLMVDKRAVGVLALFAGEVGYFDEAELKLLNELAGDISFALQYIEREERLNYLAYYDALTGLPNHALFLDRLGQLLQSAKHEQSAVAVILVDLSRFKLLNDTLGRHVGDELLKQVGERLLEARQEPCSVARVAADTFAIAVAALPLDDDATHALRNNVLKPLAAPFFTSAGELRLAARAGVALYPGDGVDGSTLFMHAEAALKQAKASGETHLYYASDINARIAEKLKLEHELRHALQQRQFEMYYQPRVNLQTGHIVGAEALIRWHHPERGLVLPSEFIPLAEESGLILPIGEWGLRSVCSQQAAWLAAHLNAVPVAVNLSAVQVNKSKLHSLLSQLLAEYRLEPRYLELELTESVMMQDPEQAEQVLQALRKLGIRLALDDFGTGYSSLAYLKRFPFDSVKIDRAFITDITLSPDDAAIATAVIDMAHRLSLNVVAEGVEQEGQLGYLRQHGCDEIQGYFFSPPVPAAEFAAMLRDAKRLAPQPAHAVEERVVLVVDDDLNILADLRKMLRQEEYRVLTATSAREGLDLLAVYPVQVIVSDQRMPGMNGIEFLGVAKELYPDTLRILLSGYTDLQSLTEAVNRGAIYKVLSKPLDEPQLREHVREAFRRFRPACATHRPVVRNESGDVWSPCL